MLVSNDDIEWQMNKQYYNGLAWAHGLILSAPTEDVKEVKHGEWIEKPNPWGQDGSHTYVCSICDEQISILGNSPNYCPNCGADMKPATNDCGVTNG